MVVLFMGLKMCRQVLDSRTEESDLDFGRSRIQLMQLKVIDDFFSFPSI
jgi:hypothetical protein